ncbi:hypothetical protein ACS3YE_004633, partial [Escherichia coli]
PRCQAICPGWLIDSTTTGKEKAGNSLACPDLYSLISRLTIYIAKTLSNLTVCFERGAEVRFKG